MKAVGRQGVVEGATQTSTSPAAGYRPRRPLLVSSSFEGSLILQV